MAACYVNGLTNEDGVVAIHERTTGRRTTGSMFFFDQLVDNGHRAGTCDTRVAGPPGSFRQSASTCSVRLAHHRIVAFGTPCLTRVFTSTHPQHHPHGVHTGHIVAFSQHTLPCLTTPPKVSIWNVHSVEGAFRSDHRMPPAVDDFARGVPSSAERGGGGRTPPLTFLTLYGEHVEQLSRVCSARVCVCVWLTSASLLFN